MTVGIIGGGASGMAAALAAAENPNAQVILFERQARVGRKLLATGNGRCNLTNRNLSISNYHGESPEFATYALAARNVEETLQWFSDLGLYTVAESNGRVYPYSDQANSVVDILRFALEKNNIMLRTGFEVRKVRRQDGMFAISSDEETVMCDKLIVACGGLAGTKLGGSISGYKLLGSMGHKSTRLRPALVQLKTGWNGIAALKGVRANCNVRIFHEDTLWAESAGEIQFTEYGVSGPVIFETSRDVCSLPGKWTCRLDFLPQWDISQLEQQLQKRMETAMPVEELLTGIVHNRLGRVLTKAAGISGGQRIAQLTLQQIRQLCACVKAFDISLTEPLGMDSAQVTAGGVLTESFDPETMESRTVPGLYACGEVLDIDGDCGGYNLQWAWSSGYLAGSCAGKDAQ